MHLNLAILLLYFVKRIYTNQFDDTANVTFMLFRCLAYGDFFILLRGFSVSSQRLKAQIVGTTQKLTTNPNQSLLLYRIKARSGYKLTLITGSAHGVLNNCDLQRSIYIDGTIVVITEL